MYMFNCQECGKTFDIEDKADLRELTGKRQYHGRTDLCIDCFEEIQDKIYDATIDNPYL